MLALALVAGAVGAGVLAANVSLAPQAQAAAGVPDPGVPVFTEGFEGYSGTPTAPFTYSTYALAGNPLYLASPQWTEGERCNGVILNQNMTNGSSVESATANKCNTSNGVQSYNFLLMLPQALQQAFGTPTGSSHPNTAVSSYTECKVSGPNQCDTLPTGTNLATGSVLFQTPQLLPTVKDRYYSFGIDTAYINCGTGPQASDPRYVFSLFETPSGPLTRIGSDLNGCSATSNPNLSTETQSVTRNFTFGGTRPQTRSVRVSRMVTDASFKATGSSLGLKLHNATGATLGNDGAFDNIRMLDVTPKLDKSFSPATIAPGGTSPISCPPV